MKGYADEVVAELVESSPLAAEIYESIKRTQAELGDWNKLKTMPNLE